ncbi:MAG: hypothetical protein AAGE94_14205 [Acidobacteriota bacterium]
MARSDELQLFSTSFIDLMACSLAGACILWVLTLDVEPAVDEPAPRRSAWVQVSQVGTNHSDRSAIEVVTDDGTWTADDFVAKSPRVTTGGASVHFELVTTGGGRADLLVENQREPVHLRFAFAVCEAYSSLHQIRIDWVDRDGAGSAIVFWTKLDNLGKALQEDAVKNTLRRAVETSDPRPTVHVLDTRATGTGASWQVKIGADGRVDLRTPPVDDTATAWLAGLLAGGGATP